MRLAGAWLPGQEGGHGGGEVGWLDGVDQVPGRYRDQLAIRDQYGHCSELFLVDVAGRAACDQQCPGLN